MLVSICQNIHLSKRENKAMITVFTPTYNRKDTLELLYNSLLKQQYKDFEWLIIDDGSTDNTKEYVESLIKKNKIKINYIYKENAGKMSAVNMAHQQAKGESFITIDSDDELSPDILKQLHEDYNLIKNNNRLAGIVYLAASKKEPDKPIGSLLPEDKTICKYTDLKTKYHITGDKATLWKSKVLKKYAFPTITGEKFIPDAYLMMQISKDYQIMTLNRIVMLVEYQAAGLTNNYFNLVKNNPIGTSLYYKELYYYDKIIYNIYGYLLFCFYGKKKMRQIITEHPAKILVILLYIPVKIIFLIRR